LENKAKETRRYQRIEQIMDFAESVMEVDGYHAPMLFSITDECFMIPHLIEGISNNSDNRRQVSSDMREILKRILLKSISCLHLIYLSSLPIAQPSYLPNL